MLARAEKLLPPGSGRWLGVGSGSTRAASIRRPVQSRPRPSTPFLRNNGFYQDPNDTGSATKVDFLLKNALPDPPVVTWAMRTDPSFVASANSLHAKMSPLPFKGLDRSNSTSEVIYLAFFVGEMQDQAEFLSWNMSTHLYAKAVAGQDA
ncbi:hypothetical protein BKA67DRAFT_645313 [Truncatella angustata]|uniref:Uncharacterized protein n=1 Tax=Truncatella angustata TaxID=152316 RepID=A0A9P8UPS5_9PEZI|nr:uncharacterized protein BKA67DRAFT_645313 [Truncatella angustata]KAH6655886.1 hypothetical protein BKA67DRAFT_645313 [Truncatella angustata]